VNPSHFRAYPCNSPCTFFLSHAIPFFHSLSLFLQFCSSLFSDSQLDPLGPNRSPKWRSSTASSLDIRLPSSPTFSLHLPVATRALIRNSGGTDSLATASSNFFIWSSKIRSEMDHSSCPPLPFSLMKFEPPPPSPLKVI